MAKNITVTLSNADMRALEFVLVDPEQWFKDMIANKVAACTERITAEAVRVLSADPAVTDMPAKPERLIAELVKRPDYKNRAQREDEEKERAKVMKAKP